MRIILALITFFFLISCNKPDPHPELKDEIYSDLTARLGEVSHQVEETEKQVVTNKKELDAVVPQTGQIKFAQKRYFESEQKLNLLRQQKEWLKIRSEERLKESQKSYRRAFKKGEKWPDSQEFEAYKDELRIRSAKKEWDVKLRMKEAGLSPAGEKKTEKKEGTKE